MVAVHLGLGSNLGDRDATLRAAIAAIGSEVTIARVSSIYETAPWGRRDQPAFLNCCVSAETAIRPRPLLALLKDIERRLGRTPADRWGPRVIDLDLLLYGDEVVADSGLVVPHPHLMERAFVLVPLAEIAGETVIAGAGLTVRDALGRVERRPGDVRRVGAPMPASPGTAP